MKFSQCRMVTVCIPISLCSKSHTNLTLVQHVHDSQKWVLSLAKSMKANFPLLHEVSAKRKRKKVSVFLPYLIWVFQNLQVYIVQHSQRFQLRTTKRLMHLRKSDEILHWRLLHPLVFPLWNNFLMFVFQNKNDRYVGSKALLLCWSGLIRMLCCDLWDGCSCFSMAIWWQTVYEYNRKCSRFAERSKVRSLRLNLPGQFCRLDLAKRLKTGSDHKHFKRLFGTKGNFVDSWRVNFPNQILHRADTIGLSRFWTCLTKVGCVSEDFRFSRWLQLMVDVNTIANELHNIAQVTYCCMFEDKASQSTLLDN